MNFSDAADVARSSEYLDLLDEDQIGREEAVAVSGGWLEAMEFFDRRRRLLLPLRRFYDRAYNQGLSVVHFASTAELVVPNGTLTF